MIMNINLQKTAGRYVLLLALGLGLAAGSSAFGQAPEAGLSLRAAAEEALKNNPGLAAAQSRERAAEKNISMAESAYYPRVDFEEIFTNSNDPVYVFGTLLRQGEFSARHFDPNFLNNPSARNNFNHRFSVQQLLYDGGKRERQKSMAATGKEISSQRVRMTEQQVLFGVIQDFYRVVLADAALKTAEESLAGIAAGLKRTRDRYEAGMAVKADVLRMEVQKADFERLRMAAQNECRQARQALERDLGREPSGTIQVSGRMRESLPENSSERDWLDLAEKQRPDLQQASMAIQLAAEKLRSTRGAYLPTLGAMANYDFHNGTDAGFGNNYLVGVRLQWNLFDGGARSAAVRQAAEEKQAAEYERRQALQQTRLEISGAQDRRRVAQQQYRVAQQAAEAAEEGLRIMENRHAEGLATTTDLLSVQVSRHQARLNILQALYQYTMEYAAMELAAGNISLQSPLFVG